MGEQNDACCVVDLGSTTVEVVFFKEGMGQVKKFINPQIAFGADVMRRLSYVSERGIGEMQNAIVSRLNKEILALGETPKKMIVCGNTAMLHFFLGVAPNRLGVAPYEAEFLDGQTADAKTLGFDFDCIVSTLPCAGAWVGADIVAGLTRCPAKDGYAVFIDLGTNAEVALYNTEKVFTASTAGGPCFEGGNISCGLPFGEGAITSFSIVGGINSIECEGDVPKGLCGSGLIDAIAELLRTGKIDENGSFMDGDGYDIARGVRLSQKDIREFQLAKSALRAGLEVLMMDAKVEYKDIEKVYIAGGFSLGINIKNACISGLIPSVWENVTQPVGNTAIRGAIDFLHSPKNAEEIVQKTTVVTLGGRQDFSDLFVKNMVFEKI